jgi:hypothetical protein
VTIGEKSLFISGRMRGRGTIFTIPEHFIVLNMAWCQEKVDNQNLTCNLAMLKSCANVNYSHKSNPKKNY